MSTYYPNEHPEIEGNWVQPLSVADEVTGNKLYASLPATELRLTIPSAYMNKFVRIYMAVPNHIPGITGLNGFEVKWQTQGVFAPGSSTLGNRSLFFEGMVKNTILADVINFEFSYDARYATDVLIFEPTFEIEKK